MKNILYFTLCLPFFLNAQIPNASFEEWSIVNGEELPDDWKSYGDIEKDTAPFEGEYAVSLASTSIYDHALLYTQFTAPEPIEKLIGVINIDSISHGGLAFIKVNAWTSSGYHTLGTFSHNEITNNYIPFEILFDLPPDPIDSIRIEARTGPTPIPDGIAIGYSAFRLDKLQLVDSMTTAIQKTDFNDAISVFPNPVLKLFQIYSEKDQVEELFLFDIKGKMVLNKTVTENNQEVYINNLDSGAYLLLIRTTNGIIFRKKLIKAR